jgi:hypothetical protein
MPSDRKPILGSDDITSGKMVYAFIFFVATMIFEFTISNLTEPTRTLGTFFYLTLGLVGLVGLVLSWVPRSKLGWELSTAIIWEMRGGRSFSRTRRGATCT